MVEHIDIALAGQLGDAVIGDRAQRMGLVGREDGRLAIDRTGRGMDELPDLVLERMLEQVERAAGIDLEVAAGVDQADILLRRRIVEDRVDALEQAVHRLALLADIHLHEAEVVPPRPGRDIAFLAGGQVVHADDVGAGGEQGFAKVRADETGASGDDDLAARPVNFRCQFHAPSAGASPAA